MFLTWGSTNHCSFTNSSVLALQQLYFNWGQSTGNAHEWWSCAPGLSRCRNPAHLQEFSSCQSNYPNAKKEAQGSTVILLHAIYLLPACSLCSSCFSVRSCISFNFITVCFISFLALIPVFLWPFISVWFSRSPSSSPCSCSRTSSPHIGIKARLKCTVIICYQQLGNNANSSVMHDTLIIAL